MRGVIGAILAGLGAFLILGAILLPTWVSSQMVKFPLSEYETATLEAKDASYFSVAKLREETGVTMQATYTIKGDASAGDSSTAVWSEFSYVYDLTNHQEVQEMTRTFAFNRRTGELVNCCGASVNGDTSVRQSGLVGYVFPIGTQKQTYEVFDTTLLRPVPFTYAGTTTVDGIPAYQFVENVPPTKVTTQTVPGSYVGSKAATVAAPEYDQLHLVYSVDPETGALIDVNEHQTVTLRNPADTSATGLVVFDADLIATPASVRYINGLDSGGRSKLALLETTLPLVFGIVGGVFLLAGIVLGWKRREETASLGGVPPEAADQADQDSSGLAVTRPGPGPDEGQAAGKGTAESSEDGSRSS